MTGTIEIVPHKNGKVTIRGLTHGDLRVVARAVSEGSWSGGDKGGPVSEALLRFESALRVPAMYPTLTTPVRLIGGTPDPHDLFEEIL